MKILHVTNAFPYPEYSSYGIFIKEQIESLAHKGLNCEVIFINAQKNGVLEYFRYRSKVKKKIKDFQPDIIHVHHEFSLIPMIFIIKKKPLILSLLGDINKRSFLNKVVYKILSSKANIVVFKNELPKGRNHRYLPNGVNTKLFKPINRALAKERLGLDIEKKYILFVSASLNNPIKRYDKFSLIVSRLNRTFGNIEELLMTDIPRSETPYYFNACEFLLMTSDHEGSPNAVKESLSCNIPVVSTNVGNVKQMLLNSSRSFVATGNCIDELYGLSIKVLSNQDELEERDLIFSQKLSIEMVADKLIEIYKDVYHE